MHPFRGTFVSLGLILALTVTTAPVRADAPTPGAPGAGDPLFPLDGNGGYHALHYGLDLSYEPATAHLDAEAVVTARATQDLSRFDLDLSGLTVRSVRVGSEPAAFRREGQELVITPRTPLRRGQVFRTTVTYDGKPEAVNEPGDPYDGWNVTDHGAFVAGEPQGSRAWFPLNNHPSDKAAFDVTITVPEGYTAVSNGRLAGLRTRHGHSTFHWHNPEPMAGYLATATIGKFRTESYRTRSGLPVYNAVDPREAAASAPVLKRLPEVLEWESGLFGPYPFGAAGAIVDHAPQIPYYALETQTRPLYCKAPTIVTLVHETAHQWFGDSVSLSRWQDIWLNEGFATYAEWLWAEQHGGPSAQQAFDDAYAKPATDPVWAFPPALPADYTHLFDDPVYTRGAMALHKIRTLVGDHAFFDVLRAWATRHRDGHGTTAEFTGLARAVSHKDPGPTVATWLYGKGKPAHP
ncbi:M1 family metallopeptidase [Streptomyces sp. UNOC14_S4]|uniref:M1 family metallopeptidase n=1 Tax=Streptomyces sp. UNOC14_S4 TaxID=2872340 RepID=UPI001E3255BA|nr:M1 family metallopeptidase [Streptomyces sp. UNOC14_S4]MCC3769512.1 M1 family metallopeptidase [Streptomyces sp. UNOC14_S4]